MSDYPPISGHAVTRGAAAIEGSSWMPQGASGLPCAIAVLKGAHRQLVADVLDHYADRLIDADEAEHREAIYALQYWAREIEP